MKVSRRVRVQCAATVVRIRLPKKTPRLRELSRVPVLFTPGRFEAHVLQRRPGSDAPPSLHSQLDSGRDPGGAPPTLHPAGPTGAGLPSGSVAVRSRLGPAAD